MKKYFFEIPIYRLSENAYHKEEEKFLLKFYNDVHLKNGRVKSNISYNKFKEKSCLYRDIWRYNEIIGYIRLYIIGHQIKGEYYQHNVTKVYKTRTKHFKFKTQKLATEITLLHKTNEDVYQSIIKYVDKCSSELVRRYIDVETFHQIGKYIDWNGLIKENINAKTK